MDMILRNFLLKLKMNHPADGYHIGIPVDGISTSDECQIIVDELVRLRCLEPGWETFGRNKIRRHFNYDRIDDVIKSGTVS